VASSGNGRFLMPITNVLSVTGICLLPFLAYLYHLVGNGRIARYQRRSLPVTKASFSRSALAPKTSDYDFAYASDIAENSGGDPGHIVELLY
jgi:hypothetical protein